MSASMEKDRMNEPVFDGVKIVDFGWIIAGPMSLKYLADYGATVICVESPNNPDALRTSSPLKDGSPGLNSSGYFAFFAANKYHISLDLKNSYAIGVAKKLITWADVVCDSHRPGVMEKYGFGYDELRKIKSDIIVVRSSNQGLTGPHAEHPGLGNHLAALSGLVNFIGWPDEEPISMPLAYTDYLTPHFAASALIAALDYRRKTGKGQMLDLSQLEVGLQFLIPPILNYQINGIEHGRTGNASPCAAPHGVYKCKGDDRWCAIAVFTDSQWRAFCRVINNSSLVERFPTMMSRKENEDELNRLVELWTMNHDAEDVMNLMQEANIAAGVVQNAKDLYEDPNLKQREFFWVLNHKELGDFSHLGQPAILSKSRAESRMPAPLFGEHTEYICREFLGISESEFDELLLAGAFGL